MLVMDLVTAFRDFVYPAFIVGTEPVSDPRLRGLRASCALGQWHS